MLFLAFDEEKATSAQRVAPAPDEGFAASGEHEQPLVRAAVAVVGTAFLVARRENHLGRLGSAVAGDYAESPAKPQVLPDQLLAYCFFSDPMPPELGAGAVVLGDVGLVVLPVELEPEPLVLLPEAPVPALPLRASRSHFSFSAPVRATHLLASLPDAPDEEELPEADGVVVLLPDEPAPALPDAPDPLLPEPEPED